MARPIWKGNISFGLVNIPISLYSAEQKSEMHFKLIDKRNKSPVRYERVNEETRQEVPWDQIVKGYEYDPDNLVVLTDEDLKSVAVEATQTIDISDFVNLESIGYVFFEKPYYVVPGKKAEKGYVLLREVLKRTGKVAIAKVVIRSRQYLAALVPQGNALILNILRYYNEVRNPSEFNFPEGDLETYKITDKELQFAEMLVNTMMSEWEPEKYHDEYRDALMSWIEERVRTGETAPVQPAEAARETGKVIDMMDLLKRSVEQVSKQRGKEEERPGRKAERPRRVGRPKAAGSDEQAKSA